MLIRVAHLAWVEWTTKPQPLKGQGNKKARPGIYRALFLPVGVYFVIYTSTGKLFYDWRTSSELRPLLLLVRNLRKKTQLGRESVIHLVFVYNRNSNPLLFPVKTISLIISIIAVCGLLTPWTSCVKNSSHLAAAIKPPSPDQSMPDSVSSPTDSTVLTYLALGDSYTIGQSVAKEDRYPVQTARLLQTEQLSCTPPEIIATTGWTTADLLNSLAASPPALTTASPARSYNFVTLLIGVNNQYQGRSQSEYKDQFTTLLQQAITLAGNKPSHVIVLSIPDYSVTPFSHGHNTSLIAAQIDSFNVINYKVSQDYKVTYLDITTDSRQALNDRSLIASDGLHFSGKEYAVWAGKLEPLMKSIMK